MRRVVPLLALLLLAPGVARAATPSPAELRQGLAGAWKGALGYRDYKSGKLFELPVSTRFAIVGDGATLLQLSDFDDGPKAGTVHITTLSLDDPAKGEVASVSARRGQKSELLTERVRVATFTDPTHWTLIYEETGEDDDKPAELRVTQTRDGDSLRSVKEVRPVGEPAAPFAMRNQTRLTRLTAP